MNGVDVNKGGGQDRRQGAGDGNRKVILDHLRWDVLESDIIIDDLVAEERAGGTDSDGRRRLGLEGISLFGMEFSPLGKVCSSKF